MTLLEAPPLGRITVVTGEALAVSYLRVSTKEQAEKEGRKKGSPSPRNVKRTNTRLHSWARSSLRSSWMRASLQRRQTVLLCSA